MMHIRGFTRLQMEMCVIPVIPYFSGGKKRQPEICFHLKAKVLQDTKKVLSK